MANYLILGAGRFGCLALERLARLDGAASFLVVDRDPLALARALGAGGGPGRRGVAREAVAFLVEHLRGGSAWDWIVPMVPVHVAYGWLLAGPLAGSAWQPAAVPESLALPAVAVQRGAAGEVYLSRARHRCPDDCAEPEICPVTGESREIPLYRELAALALPGWQVRVIPSRQLAPGVGGYAPGQLLELARDLRSLQGKVLVATACRCHGVMQGLTQRLSDNV